MTTVTPIKPQPPPTAATRGRMALANISRGRIDKPDRILVIGQEGVGKTTFAANAPAPIFICAEDGTSHVDVARFPEPERFGDVIDAVRALVTDPHEYQTLVIDTLDWLEPLVWAHVCESGKKPDIEAFGYGKGYIAALDQWRALLAVIDAVRNARNMGVILLAHAHIKTFKNPEGEDFDRYTGKLHEKAYGLIREWCDHVLFARFQTYTIEKDGRHKGISDGARVLCTTRTAAYDAKNRADLPPELPLSWEDFATAAKRHAPASPEKFVTECESLLPVVGDADGKLGAYLATIRGDAAKLAHFTNRLRAKAAEKGVQS